MSREAKFDLMIRTFVVMDLTFHVDWYVGHVAFVLHMGCYFTIVITGCLDGFSFGCVNVGVCL